ncbi:hypothetical protein BH09ACT7_BH09ACT7_48970 [soil metagenome]
MNRFGRTLGVAVLCGGLAVASTLGITAGIAQADTTTAVPAPPPDPSLPQNTDQLLAYIAQEYDTGAGGGQVSNLIHSVLQLRAQGVKPSESNRLAILDALGYRPNQVPLTNALKDTLAYQQKTLQRMTPPAQGGYTVGINQYDPANPGVLGGFGVTGPNGGGVGVGNGGVGISGG